MQCNTLKPGWECAFMSTGGCGFAEPKASGRNECEPVVEECTGCENVHEFLAVKYCKSFPSPEDKWRLGLCNFATHKKVAKASQDPKVNPLKASKRASRGG